MKTAWKPASAGDSQHGGAPAADRPVVPLRELSRSLPMALLCAREAVMQYFRPLHRAHGITEQQWRVLRVLNKCGDLEIGELARQAVLMPPSLSRILRDLEAAGMVSRRVVARDLRRALISITPVGLGLLAKIAPLSQACLAQIRQLYGPERLERLSELLYELERSLSKPPEASARGPARALHPGSRSRRRPGRGRPAAAKKPIGTGTRPSS